MDQEKKTEEKKEKPRALVIDDGADKTIEIEIEVGDIEKPEKIKISFVVGPDGFQHTAAALKFAAVYDLIIPGAGGRLQAVDFYKAISRVKSWTGIELADGSPCPCTEAAKLRVFGVYPQALLKFKNALEEKERQDLKN